MISSIEKEHIWNALSRWFINVKFSDHWILNMTNLWYAIPFLKKHLYEKLRNIFFTSLPSFSQPIKSMLREDQYWIVLCNKNTRFNFPLFKRSSCENTTQIVPKHFIFSWMKEICQISSVYILWSQISKCDNRTQIEINFTMWFYTILEIFINHIEKGGKIVAGKKTHNRCLKREEYRCM